MEMMGSWDDVRDAFFCMIENRLPLHGNPPKNWDMSKLYDFVKDMDHNISILDFGCSGGYTLKLLHNLGFKDVTGVDLYPLCNTKNWMNYMRDKLFSFLSHFNGDGFDVVRGDGLDFYLKNKVFDLVTCVSVIEHGVPLSFFFGHCKSILKKDGLLFLTTDYNHRKINTGSDEWTIFDKDGIDELIDIAIRSGFELIGERVIPDENDGLVMSSTGLRDKYTFMALIFRRI